MRCRELFNYTNHYRRDRPRRLIGARLVLAAVFALVFTGGIAGAVLAQSDGAAPKPDPRAAPGMHVRPGFELAILVDDESDLSGRQTVDSAGNITFGFKDQAGTIALTLPVSVRDKTVEEARVAVTAALSAYVKYPTVRIIVTHVPGLRVEVRGAAVKVGPVNLVPDAKLSDALAAAGIAQNADLSNVLIIRRTRPSTSGDPARPAIAGETSLRVDMDAYMRGESSSDPALQPDDLIRIGALPAAAMRPELQVVRIIGEVEREADIPFRSGMRASDALAAVGGLKETADRAKIRVVRGKDAHVLEIDADRFGANDPANNVPLGPGDLIIVGVRDRSLRFCVMGAVLRQGTFLYAEADRMTVMKALALVGGITKNGDTHHVRLRKGFLANPAASRDIPFDVEKILARKQPDLPIDAGDELEVPPKQRRPNLLMELAPLLLHFVPL